MPYREDGSFMVLDRNLSEPKRYQTLTIAGAVLFSALTAITAKSMMEWCCEAPPNHIHRFQRPWFLTLSHVVGMALCIVPYTISKFSKFVKQQTQIILKHSTPEGNFLFPRTKFERIPLKMAGKLLLLGGVEILATLLTAVGLLWTSASVFMSLRSSLSVFSAAISFVVFKRKLFLFQSLGLSIILAGLLVVGAASVTERASFLPEPCLGNEDHETEKDRELQGLLGVCFVFFGQLVSASQYALEEKLQCDAGVPPLLLVAIQGGWGLLILAVIVPLLNLTKSCNDSSNDLCHLSVFYHEDAITTYQALKSSPHLLSLSFVYALAVVLWNTCGVRATRFLSRKKRTIVEISRIFIVWVCDLGLFYLGGGWFHRIRGETSAEKWREWSWLQLAGVVMLGVGLFVFNHLVKIPGLWYPSKWSMAEWAEKGAIVGEAAIDPIWRRSDRRDCDSIRRGFYTRIGIKNNNQRRVRFSPGYTVIPDLLPVPLPSTTTATNGEEKKGGEEERRKEGGGGGGDASVNNNNNNNNSDINSSLGLQSATPSPSLSDATLAQSLSSSLSSSSFPMSTAAAAAINSNSNQEALLFEDIPAPPPSTASISSISSPPKKIPPPPAPSGSINRGKEHAMAQF